MVDEDKHPAQILDPADPGEVIMRLFYRKIIFMLTDEATSAGLKAAELEMIRKLLADNSVTFSSVKKGSYGDFAKQVAEDFPFPVQAEEGGPVFQ